MVNAHYVYTPGPSHLIIPALLSLVYLPMMLYVSMVSIYLFFLVRQFVYRGEPLLAVHGMELHTGMEINLVPVPLISTFGRARNTDCMPILTIRWLCLYLELDTLID